MVNIDLKVIEKVNKFNKMLVNNKSKTLIQLHNNNVLK